MSRWALRLVALLALLWLGCDDSPPIPPVSSPDDSDEVTESSPFIDVGLDAGVRLQLRLEDAVPMPTAALDCLRVLVASDFDVTDLTGVERLAALQTLDISANRIADLTPLSALHQLQRLDASSNQIQSVQPLGQLSQLSVLYLDHNDIEDVTPLLAADSLVQVDLTGNPLSASGLQDLSKSGVLVRFGSQHIEPDPCDNPPIRRTGTFTAEVNRDLLIFRSGSRCLNVIGSLTVEDEVDDLTPLTKLTDITGTLRIRRTESVSDLSFLALLSNVGGDLAITDNDIMTSISGLGRLRSVEDRFIVKANPVLQSLGVMESLSTVAELRIESNPVLEDISGLESLGAVSGNFVMSGNDQLIDVEGLRNLEEIDGSLSFDNNDLVEHVQGFRGLRRIGGSLRVRLNNELRSLAGLDPDEIGNVIDISRNPNLSQGEVDLFVERMQSRGFDGTVLTGGNGD
ncbi:MAG: hypothetical protein HN712_17655 [Gemmatimonadetes bacterium]|nr:hypothetical protein [Gemmatimonadota bacterium]MBT7862147.1 hypothetical protein [Gemmatimonadota bacterium]